MIDTTSHNDTCLCHRCQLKRFGAECPQHLHTAKTNTARIMAQKSDQSNEVVPAGRAVIESKLLTTLEDEGTVAVLYSEADLQILIHALDAYNSSGAGNDRSREMLIGIAQLYQEAFA